MKEVTERVERAYNKYSIQLFYKAGYTIRNVVVFPKTEIYLGERSQEHDKTLK